jgi:Amidohydrolase family
LTKPVPAGAGKDRVSASGTWSRCFKAYSLRATLPVSVREIGFDGSNAGRMAPLVNWTLFWQALLFSRDTACHRSRRRSVTAFSRAQRRCRMQHDREYVLDHAGNLHPAARSRQRTLACRRTKFAAAHHLPPGVIEMATIAGARAAHLDRKIGSLTPGKEADLLCWRPTASTFPH